MQLFLNKFVNILRLIELSFYGVIFDIFTYFLCKLRFYFNVTFEYRRTFHCYKYYVR